MDKSWHKGASYAPPIFNANHEEITADNKDVFFNLTHTDYITIEGIEFRGFAKTTPTVRYCSVIQMDNGGAEGKDLEEHHMTVNKIRDVDWKIANAEDAFSGSECSVVHHATARPGR